MYIFFYSYLLKCKFIIFLILLSFAQIYGSTLPGLPLIRNYNPEEYSGGIQNWQISQDRKGIIYVANNFGLLQFDGNDWHQFNVTNATKMRSLAINENGRIYAGYQGDFGYFEADSIGQLNYVSLKSKIPEKYREIDETWKTYFIKGKAYFCTFSYVYVYEDDQIRVIDPQSILDISFESKNKIYSHIPSKGLHVIENGRFHSKEHMTFFSDKIVSSVTSIDENNLLITTSRNGIWLLGPKGIRPFNRNLNALFEETFINCALLLSNGNLAIGTQNNGIYIIDLEGNILINVNKERGLLSRTILSIFEDQNKNIWVGQNNGISFLEVQSPFREINENIGLPGTGYSAISSQNDLYLGTNNGVYSFDGEPQEVSGSEGQTYFLQEVSGNLILNHNEGAFFINDNKAENFFNNTGSWMFVKWFNYYFQGAYDGIYVYRNNLNNKVGKINSFYESSRILTLDKDSILWVSHGYKGLFKISLSRERLLDPKIEFFNRENGLPTNLQNTITKIDGEIKVISEEGILNYDYKSKTFSQDSILSSYFNGSQVNVMKPDVFGNIYFITNTSLGFLEKIGPNNYVKHDQSFNKVRKLLNDDLPNINIINANQVLFGAKEGFVLFDRNNFYEQSEEKFYTLIRDVYNSYDTLFTYLAGNMHLNGRSGTHSIPEINYKQNNITFRFSSTSYSTTTNPQFQYKLEGFNKEWSEWTNVNSKDYTNLREGEYIFQVRSKNALNQISEVEEFKFTVLSPWYRSPMAYIIYVVLSLTALISLMVVLDKRYEKEKQKLDRKRLEEIGEKEKQLDTITKQSESEIEQLKNEKLQSEIDYMNSELATNTMHLLNKNEFINGVKSNLESVVKKSTNEEVKSNIRKIVKEIEKNVQDEDDWANFQIHFDKVHGDFSKRFQTEYPKLSPQDVKLSTYLRLNLSTKEIANLLNISVRGVEIARYRLRKKLNLERSQNLTEFILNY